VTFPPAVLNDGEPVTGEAAMADGREDDAARGDVGEKMGYSTRFAPSIWAAPVIMFLT
jgi:hypothetical protein